MLFKGPLRFCVLSVNVLMLIVLGVSGCQSVPTQAVSDSYEESIRRVLEEDARLGGKRNENTKRMTVSAASLAYADELHGLDYAGAPAEFRDAFWLHADAWRSLGLLLADHPQIDRHRLEMHDAIQRMKEDDSGVARMIESSLAQVWSTWGEIESEAESYGVNSE